MKEHPDIVKFCHFSAYVRTRSAGILMGLAPWHTDFGTKSSVLHLVRGVQAPGTHVRSDYPQTRHIGGRSSSHKATLIPQNKRQDTITTMIPCLCSFTVPSSPSAELVGAKLLHLLTQTVLLLKHPTGVFVAVANAKPPINKNIPEPFFKNRVRVRTVWWRMGDSNPRPLRCERSALTS